MIRVALASGALLATTVGHPLSAQTSPTEAPVSLTGQFIELCGSEEISQERLPGEDVQLADAPFQLAQYARNAISYRIVKVGDRFAMRSHSPSRADPIHALILRCALTGKESLLSDVVTGLSEVLGVAPVLTKTSGGFESASFRVGLRTYTAYAEPDGWVSVFSMDIMMRNIDPRYLEKGATPVSIPPAE